MPTPFRIITAALLAPVLALAAADPSQGGDHGVPYYPTTLNLSINGQMLPIVAAKGTSPVIRDAAGKERRIKEDLPILPTLADSFTPGFITFHELELTNVSQAPRGTELGADEKTDERLKWIQAFISFIDGKFTSDRDLHHCFIATVVFDGGFLTGDTDSPAPAVVLNDLGEITAGKPKKIHLSNRAFARKGPRAKFFVAVFADGHEVRTNRSEVKDAFFWQADNLRHRDAFNRYLAKYESEDHDPAPLSVLPIFLPDGKRITDLGGSVVAHIDLSNVGRVENVSLDPQPSDVQVKAALLRSIRGWRFLPKLEGGAPVPCKIDSPLQ